MRQPPNPADTGFPKAQSGAKTFWKYFLIALCLGTIICVAASAIYTKVSNIQIFGPTEVNLATDMPTLVDENSQFFEAFQDKNRINVLLLGINGNLTDTIMVASFDFKAKHVDLISIPRDTYYFRPQYANSPGFLKINSVYEGTKEPLEIATVVSEILLGMPINSYVIVDYKGIEKIVDTMGGVPMDIPFHLKYNDPTDTPPLHIDIPAGKQVLDGKHAVQFLRYRHGYTEGDIGRIKAQQTFMRSAFKQMLSTDLPKTAKVIFNNVNSDIKFSVATKIAAEAIGMSGTDINTYIMPNTLQDVAPYYVYPDSEGIAKMLEKIYSIEPKSATDSAVKE